MKIKIIAVGKIKENIYSEKISEYIKWISKDIKIELVALKNYKETKLNHRLTSYIRKSNYNIFMSDGGKKNTSIQFSNFIFNQNKDLIFFIGGPNGHSEKLLNHADKILSLSKMTFPHEMALLILTEQLYRAISIKKRTKYHRY